MGVAETGIKESGLSHGVEFLQVISSDSPITSFAWRSWLCMGLWLGASLSCL